jgi:hypothetical protein
MGNPPIAGPPKLPAMSLARLRLWGVNTLIAALFALVVIDALPFAPPALQDALRPVTRRIGLAQGWGLFAPGPDSVNTRLRAEITYRDGKKATWNSPDWPQQGLWQRFIGHRHEEWYDNTWTQEDAPAWTGWARHLARQMRPEDPQADRGAEVKIIVLESPIPPPEIKPWKTRATATSFDQSYTLTIEKLP